MLVAWQRDRRPKRPAAEMRPLAFIALSLVALAIAAGVARALLS